jgi:hypothetical protein
MGVSKNWQMARVQVGWCFNWWVDGSVGLCLLSEPLCEELALGVRNPTRLACWETMLFHLLVNFLCGWLIGVRYKL